MILGDLRYLGRGWTFDDIEEATAINKETHRQCFHIYIDFGSTEMYERFVIVPTSGEEAATHLKGMETVGFHGCVGSTDVTHVGMERCSYRLAQIHRGGKLPMPSRTYNMTVNHRRQILSSTFGHPTRWNDKTLQSYDSFVTGIQQGTKLDDVTFELVEADKDGNIVFVKYEGAG